jgi:hypothetical protein
MRWASPVKQRQRRRGLWQPRFWGHTIEDNENVSHDFDDALYSQCAQQALRLLILRKTMSYSSQLRSHGTQSVGFVGADSLRWSGNQDELA